MYVLMRKDKVIARFNLVNGNVDYIEEVDINNWVFGNNSIDVESFLLNRISYVSDRPKVDALLDCIDAPNMFEKEHLDNYIKHQHAASLLDDYWVKEEVESLSWSDVSLFDLEPCKLYSDILVDNTINMYDMCGSNQYPIHEFGVDGNIMKRISKEDNKLYVYSYVSNDVSYWNYMSYLLRTKFDNNLVKVELVNEDGKLYTRSKLFTSDSISYMSKGDVVYTEELDENLIDSLLGDYLTIVKCNEYNANGILIDNNTNEIIGVAPHACLDCSLKLSVNADVLIGTYNSMDALCKGLNDKHIKVLNELLLFSFSEDEVTNISDKLVNEFVGVVRKQARIILKAVAKLNAGDDNVEYNKQNKQVKNVSIMQKLLSILSFK